VNQGRHSEWRSDASTWGAISRLERRSCGVAILPLCSWFDEWRVRMGGIVRKRCPLSRSENLPTPSCETSARIRRTPLPREMGLQGCPTGNGAPANRGHFLAVTCQRAPCVQKEPTNCLSYRRVTNWGGTSYRLHREEGTSFRPRRREWTIVIRQGYGKCGMDGATTPEKDRRK